MLATLGNAQVVPVGRPNVVLVITDDLGWADIGAYGGTDVRTPHIDSLARDGVRLTDFYANGTTCAPTRAGLMTGRYQQRYALETPLPSGSRADRGLPGTGYSLPQLLKNHGYATAQAGESPVRSRDGRSFRNRRVAGADADGHFGLPLRADGKAMRIVSKPPSAGDAESASRLTSQRIVSASALPIRNSPLAA